MKRGQQSFGMSIEMIFTIFLIIVFLGFAVWGILVVLKQGNEAKVNLFAQDLKSDVDKAWVSELSESTFKYNSMPTEVAYVCFVDLNEIAKGQNADFYDEFRNPNSNLYIYPTNAIGNEKSFNIAHVDLNNSLKYENPLCIKNNKGRVYIHLRKDFTTSQLVEVSRE